MLSLEMALGMSIREFRRSFWRRQPLFVKGGAKFIYPLNENHFFQLRTDSLKNQPQNVREQSGVCSLERVDTVSKIHWHMSQNLATSLDCQKAHFNVNSATNGNGMGSRFDASDNFVMQQSGITIWRLHNPDNLREAEILERLAGRGLGRVPEIVPQHEFILEPGDLLYVPLFWIQSEKSLGDSLSQSVVFQPNHL